MLACRAKGGRGASPLSWRSRARDEADLRLTRLCSRKFARLRRRRPRGRADRRRDKTRCWANCGGATFGWLRPVQVACLLGGSVMSCVGLREHGRGLRDCARERELGIHHCVAADHPQRVPGHAGCLARDTLRETVVSPSRSSAPSAVCSMFTGISSCVCGADPQLPGDRQTAVPFGEGRGGAHDPRASFHIEEVGRAPMLVAPLVPGVEASVSIVSSADGLVRSNRQAATRRG